MPPKKRTLKEQIADRAAEREAKRKKGNTKASRRFVEGVSTPGIRGKFPRAVENWNTVRIAKGKMPALEEARRRHLTNLRTITSGTVHQHIEEAYRTNEAKIHKLINVMKTPGRYFWEDGIWKNTYRPPDPGPGGGGAGYVINFS